MSYYEYNKYLNTSVQTERDTDNNLLSITSSDISYTDETQFLEIENTNYSYNLNSGVIDFDFKEIDIDIETIDDKKSKMFNLYNEVKNDVNITGSIESHEYLFNSSKNFLNKDNLIILDNNEYSNLIIDYSNSIDDLNVCEQRSIAEKEIYNRQNTAIYDTFNNIVNTSIQIMDSTILPTIKDSSILSLMYSLKAILAQSTKYLLDNKSSLMNKTVKFSDFESYNKNGIPTKRENNTITYTYLSNQQPLIDAFGTISQNYSDSSKLISEITTLQLQNDKLTKDIQSALNDITKVKEDDQKIIDALNAQIVKLQTYVNELKNINLQIQNDSKLNRDVMNRYNIAYDITISIMNNLINNTDKILNSDISMLVDINKSDIENIIDGINKLQTDVLSSIKIEINNGNSEIINTNNSFYTILNNFINDSNHILLLDSNIKTFIEENNYYSATKILNAYKLYSQNTLHNITTLGKL